MLSSRDIKQAARAAGFDGCGLAKAAPLSAERQRQWADYIARGYHGRMDYLSRHADLRADPRRLVEGAKTVVSVILNYYHPLSGLAATDWRMARYAYADDYHDVVKAGLRRMMASLGLVEGVDGRCFVDTAPIDEKYWAERAGLGVRGRHTQLIVPGAGSFFFLGELILTAEVDSYDDAPPAAAPQALSLCAGCRRCVEACPTGALLGNGEMDASRCLSYLTIEYRGPLSPDVGRAMQPTIYGCDRCAEACPWNVRYASPAVHPALRPRPALLAMRRADWQQLDRTTYLSLFRKSAVKRVKLEGLLRNIRAVDATEGPEEAATSAATAPRHP